MRKVDIAKQLGKKAQQNGMDRLSRFDAELQGMLSLIHRTNVSLLKAWYAGYDEALAEANGAPTAQELQERVAKAEAAGKAAFAAGLISTPALDPNLSPLISSCQPGQGVKVIEAWTRGWHNANLGIDPERQRKLDLIWSKVGAEYRGLSTDGKRSIMRWAKYGGGLIDLDALPDAEVEDMASFYAKVK